MNKHGQGINSTRGTELEADGRSGVGNEMVETLSKICIIDDFLSTIFCCF